MGCHAIARVEIDLPEKFLRPISTLLGYGIKIEAPAGISIHDVLAGILRIDADYLETSVQTILLDGKPVDDPCGHRVFAPATIALSAALPGLFGAAFRKGGTFSPMRFKAETAPECSGTTGRTIEITIKFFNMVAAALGPELLRCGIRIETADFLRYLAQNPELDHAESTLIRIDGDAATPETLAARLAGAGPEMFLFARPI